MAGKVKLNIKKIELEITVIDERGEHTTTLVSGERQFVLDVGQPAKPKKKGNRSNAS